MVICNNGGDVINEGRNGTAFATNVMGVDGIISRQQSGAVSYYLKNAHGDIVYTLNDSRTKTATYKYSTWGETMDEYDSNTSSPNPIKYSGEYEDSESGMIYLRGRYYDPELRRFITEDPAKDGLNWYAYCGNNPVMYVDPWDKTLEAVNKYKNDNGLWNFGDYEGVVGLTTWMALGLQYDKDIIIFKEKQFMRDFDTYILTFDVKYTTDENGILTGYYGDIEIRVDCSVPKMDYDVISHDNPITNADYLEINLEVQRTIHIYTVPFTNFSIGEISDILYVQVRESTK